MLSLKKIWNNKIVNNGIWMYLLQFFNFIIPLLTLPYITRILGSYQYGIFSSSFNIVGYLQVVVEYGFAMSATREVSLNNNYKHLCKIFSSIVVSRLLLFVICCLISYIYLIVWKPNRIGVYCFLLLLISVFAIIIQQNWLFQGLQDMRFIAIANIIARTVTTIFIFCFVKSKNDVLIYSFLYAISPVISNIIGLMITKLKYHIKFMKVTVNDIFTELKTGWYIFTTQITSKVFGSIGVTFLIFFSSSKVVGIFSAIQKIPTIMLLLWNPISQILYPVVSKKMSMSFEEGKSFVLNIRKYILCIFGIITIMISLFSKQIVRLAFGAEFAIYFYWLIPLVFWLLISIDNNFWGIQILLGSGHDKEYSFCFQINVVLTILLSGLLTYFFGGFGASIAPLIAELILDIQLIHVVKNID